MLAQAIFAYFTRETLFINLEVVMRENFAFPTSGFDTISYGKYFCAVKMHTITDITSIAIYRINLLTEFATLWTHPYGVYLLTL